MEGVPSPLQVGSPATRRTPSSHHVPSALRIASPTVERGTPPLPQRPGLTRKNTSGSDRLSQLLPSRPSSDASASPDWLSSRRTSYPTSLVPAAEPAYRIPRAPAPPSFAEATSMLSRDPPEQQHIPPISRESNTKRFITSFTSGRSRSKGGGYNRLEDEESAFSRSRLRGVEETDEPLGYDISAYEGLPMKQFEPKKRDDPALAAQHARDLSEAGYAAEFERLEGELGSGMRSVVEVPFTHKPVQHLYEGRFGPGLSAAEVVRTARAAQREAEKTGDIVAVSEIPIDISETFGGPDLDSHSMLTTSRTADEDSKKSYYFPEDPEQPSWRPFSMGWPWLSLLVTIAILLAGVQEFLCQLSMERAKNHEGLAEFENPTDLSILEYFTWKYAPILFFVIYGIMWQVSDFEVKRLEPFYQLSKKTGATAGESLNMDYLTFMSWLVPLRALRHKQYAVIYVSLCTLVSSSLVPILQSASVNVYPPKKDRKEGELKYIRIEPHWSRAVTACLVFVAICGCVLIHKMRRKSGLLSDPKGIAGIAAMATRSHILNEFRGLDTVPLNKIHKQLRHRRYILHKSSLWQGEFIRNSNEKIHEQGTDPRPLMLRRRAGVPYICFIICFAASIPIFMFVEGANNVTEKLPFLLTSLAIIIKLLWATLNCDIRMLEPFHILSRRNAPARTLTLDYTGTNPIFLPIKALHNKHYLVALVALCSIFTEVLTVCVSSFAVDGTQFLPGQEHGRGNTDETVRSFWISFALVMGILFTLVITACLVYYRRSHRFMPRQIGTIAAVLAYIHQSKMLVNFIDTWGLDSAHMTRHLERQRKTYGLGWFVGRDGEDHCGIDEEPLRASYKFGEDRATERLTGTAVGSWDHYDG